MRARQKNRLLRNVCRACIPSLVARKRPAPRTLRLACGMVNVRLQCNLYCPCSSKGLMSRKTARKDARQMCRQKDFSLVGTLSKTHACTQQGHVTQNHEKQVNNHIYSLFILSHGAESKRRYFKKSLCFCDGNKPWSNICHPHYILGMWGRTPEAFVHSTNAVTYFR